MGNRLRQAPRDVAGLIWFFLRGHGRWIANGWTWVSHGDLRADVTPSSPPAVARGGTGRL